MKKYSDDPIVEFVHNDREERYENLLRVVTGDYVTPFKQLEKRHIKACRKRKLMF